jgi:2,3-bisphosphoglycerate-dependent phosphoglycerate mutase
MTQKIQHIVLFTLLVLTCVACDEQIKIPLVIKSVGAEGTIRTATDSVFTVPHYADPSYTVLYLVRHCEKAVGEPNNPPLTAEGEARAERLGRIFDDARIDRIAYTNTKRSTQTATIVKRWAGDPTYENFPPEMTMDWLPDMLSRSAGQKIIHVGHSNTIPQILNYLTNTKQWKNITDTEYGMFYIVTTKGVGQTEVLECKF